jgi:hypothetical protein
MERDFAAGVYHSLWTGDKVNHVGIFDPALGTVAPLTFSLVPLSPLFPCVLLKYSTVYTERVWLGGVGGVDF